MTIHEPIQFEAHGRQPWAFASIELLAAAATVAVLIVPLLPEMQKLREATNRTVAINNIKQFGLAFHNYNSSHGVFPPDLEHLGIKAEQQGYRFSYTPTRSGFRVEATPAAPGKTGVVDLAVDERNRVEESPTAEVQGIQRRMWDNIQDGGLVAIARLMNTESLEEAMNESLALSDSKLARIVALEELDANGDLRIEVKEILQMEQDVDSPISEFVLTVREEMAFGAGGEDLSGIAVDWAYGALLPPRD